MESKATEEQAAQGARAQGASPRPEPESPSTAQRSLLLLVAAAVIVVDHISKLYVESWLPLNRSWAPFPELAHLFRITHVTNTGAAFGLFPGGSLFFTVIATVVAIFILYYNYQLPTGQHPLRIALGLQLGGALGNLIDRLRLGHVTDFLDFGPWPVFNLADTSIVAGVVILAILMLQEQRELREHSGPGGDEGEQERSELQSVAQDRATPLRDGQMVNFKSTPPNERAT
ncbi:MAG: signal peptidase II [Candidatus Promineifilaceae bacterium]|nr:signal peptidase II [Candidatus Promineifilaceae bacterium]